jgi:hypothetical protein
VTRRPPREAITPHDMAREVADRMIGMFTRDEAGAARSTAARERFQQDPHWRDLLLFNEYFHGDNGAGLGANHQTGWTGLVANLIDEWRRVVWAQPRGAALPV